MMGLHWSWSHTPPAPKRWAWWTLCPTGLPPVRISARECARSTASACMLYGYELALYEAEDGRYIYRCTFRSVYPWEPRTDIYTIAPTADVCAMVYAIPPVITSVAFALDCRRAYDLARATLCVQAGCVRTLGREEAACPFPGE